MRWRFARVSWATAALLACICAVVLPSAKGDKPPADAPDGVLKKPIPDRLVVLSMCRHSRSRTA